MAGWHHWLDGHEFEWTLGDGDGQGGLACCDSQGHKESDTTEQLNWTELKVIILCAKSLQLCLTLCDPMDNHVTSSSAPKFTLLARVVTSAWNIFPPDLHLANIYHLEFKYHQRGLHKPPIIALTPSLTLSTLLWFISFTALISIRLTYLLCPPPRMPTLWGRQPVNPAHHCILSPPFALSLSFQ